jgi:hypothetical protein
MSKTSRDIFPKEKDDKNTIDLCHLNPLKKIWTSDILTSSAKTIQENLSVNIHTFAHVYYVHLGITCIILLQNIGPEKNGKDGLSKF